MTPRRSFKRWNYFIRPPKGTNQLFFWRAHRGRPLLFVLLLRNVITRCKCAEPSLLQLALLLLLYTVAIETELWLKNLERELLNTEGGQYLCKNEGGGVKSYGRSESSGRCSYTHPSRVSDSVLEDIRSYGGGGAPRV